MSSPTMDALRVILNRPYPAEIRFTKSWDCADLVQFRFPRSKKKRIRNKWSKRKENWRYVPWPNLIKIGESDFIGHPDTIYTLERMLLDEHLNRASKEVAKWPEWKQMVLGPI